jgi:hypothetical protein
MRIGRGRPSRQQTLHRRAIERMHPDHRQSPSGTRRARHHKHFAARAIAAIRLARINLENGSQSEDANGSHHVEQRQCVEPSPFVFGH